MKRTTLGDLQVSVQDRTAFGSLDHYKSLGRAYLTLLRLMRPTRIVSPSHPNYIFYQYGRRYGHRITRPLNADLFIASARGFQVAFDRFVAFLADLRRYQRRAVARRSVSNYLKTGEINRVIYTAQQSIGCIGDSFENPNQSRKRIGQLFETLVRLVIQEVGLECEPRTISLPIPDHPGYTMPYELDLVFSRGKAIVASESAFLRADEVVGSVKTTSKDRLDKVFLDKYLLTKLLRRSVPVVAVFLHDVQRAQRGSSIFGVNSTFKSNHFLGYTVALNRLDGVYYIDPRPEMIEDERLREHIHGFQRFLVHDLWALTEG